MSKPIYFLITIEALFGIIFLILFFKNKKAGYSTEEIFAWGSHFLLAMAFFACIIPIFLVMSLF